MIVLQKFPEIWNTPISEIEQWYNDQPESEGVWRKVKFAKDTKWNVRKFPQFIETVQNWLDGRNLYSVLADLAMVGTTEENFNSLNNTIQKHLYGIGRMTSWLAIQTMYEFFHWDIDHWDLQLKEEGCWSQYKALCYLANKPEWVEEKTKETIEWMNGYTQTLMQYLNARSDFHIDIYNVESVLCEYRKTAAEKKPREFTGWTIQELLYEYHELKALWPEIDWTPYILGIMSKGEHLSTPGYSKIYFQVVQKTGLNFNTHYYFDDEPNAYEVVDVPRPEECEQPIEILQDYMAIPEETRVLYKNIFAPALHLRWKESV